MVHAWPFKVQKQTLHFLTRLDSAKIAVRSDVVQPSLNYLSVFTSKALNLKELRMWKWKFSVGVGYVFNNVDY